MRAYLEVIVRDKDGKVVKRGRHRAHSFVNNFLKMIEGCLFTPGKGNAVTTTIVRPDGTNATVYLERYGSYGGSGGTPMACKAPDNDDSYGIIAGSGTTPFNLNQYALSSKIAHGTGSGQLDYGPVDVTDLGLDETVSPPVYKFRFLRSFTNFTSTGITITEVGLYARNYWADSTVVDIKFAIARDLLPTSYTIPAGGTGTIVYDAEVEVG